MRPVQIRLASLTAIVGMALIGNGIDGSLGAGLALVGSVAAGFLVALVATKGPVKRSSGTQASRACLPTTSEIRPLTCSRRRSSSATSPAYD
jgi:hypothetical protein